MKKKTIDLLRKKGVVGDFKCEENIRVIILIFYIIDFSFIILSDLFFFGIGAFYVNSCVI